MNFRTAITGLVFSTLIVAATGADEIDFAKDVRPILAEACYACHGPDANARETDLRLDHRESALKSKVLSSGEMLKRLLSDSPDERMPPADAKRVFSDDDRAKLVRWLNAGANWPENDLHWAFIPPVRPEQPAVKDTGWPKNGIDHFVLSRLEQAKLQPSPDADKATLLRRVTFDLTGLPPTIEELGAFLADDSDNAYESVVDRLLESERFGEHMALDWLEASRYADTDGYQNDRLRYMWVWRDWLISALNKNMPFDQFVTQQMAGDLLPDRNFYTQVATGFNRNHRINSEGGSIPDEWIVEYVADRVETTGTMFLGLTMTCSRCHDHKYDPITQRDFYSLFAFFNNIAEAGLGPNNGNSPPFIPVPKSWPNLSDEESKFVEPEPVQIKIQQVSVPRPQPGSPQTVMVLHELKKPRDTFRLNRGLYDQPDKSEKLSPATPTILGGWQKNWPQNRLGLSKWLMSPENPLTARVTMNLATLLWTRPGEDQRELWRTGRDAFASKTAGLAGDRVCQTQLGCQSNAQTDRHERHLSTVVRGSEKLLRRDPENRLLARGPRRRLSPFAIRDAALFNSGLLIEKIGGPSVKPYMPPGIWKSISNAKYVQDKGDKLYRRSMYTYWRRTVPPPTMMAFNAAARETCIVRSDTTTTPLQALTMLNNVTFVESARFLAERMLARHEDVPGGRIRWAFRLVTSREPRPSEVKLLAQDLTAFAKEFKDHPESAAELLATGEKPFDKNLDVSTLAAYTLVANTILNLDESMSQN